MKIKDLKLNPNSPRQIKGERLAVLKKSIQDFEKMLELRPIVVDENNVVLGGNMRLQALKALGYKDIPDLWVKKACDLSEDEKKQFIIKDNVAKGDLLNTYPCLVGTAKINDILNRKRTDKYPSYQPYFTIKP